MDIFNSEIKDCINSIIENKLPILKENKDFNEKYSQLNNTMDELERSLSNNQKILFNNLIKLFYETEEYYFTLSYFLGLKCGKDIKKL